MGRTVYCFSVLGCALLGAAALSLSSHGLMAIRAEVGASTRVEVAIENYAYQPDPITVSAGTTVIWTNRDEVGHTVVSNDKLFSSPELAANDRFEYTFKKPGTFPYFCSLHPEMKGKVIVK